jgi:VRR-NUC domain.
VGLFVIRVSQGAVLDAGALLKTRPESEKAFQARVVALAKMRGWWVQHQYDSRRSEPGWPDLALLRCGRFMLRELKAERGRMTEEQSNCLAMLVYAGVDAKVWRPSMWDTIVEELK